MSIRAKLNETAGKVPYAGKVLAYPISKSEIEDKITKIFEKLLYPLKLPSENPSIEEKLEAGLKVTKVCRNLGLYGGVGIPAIGLIQSIGPENVSLDYFLIEFVSIYCGASFLYMASIFQKEIKRLKHDLGEHCKSASKL